VIFVLSKLKYPPNLKSSENTRLNLLEHTVEVQSITLLVGLTLKALSTIAISELIKVFI